MRNKRRPTQDEMCIITGMIAKGFSRTAIAKRIGMKNKTLERICEDWGIPMNAPMARALTNKTNISGEVTTKHGIINFHNLYELYCLLKWHGDDKVESVQPETSLGKFRVKRRGCESKTITVIPNPLAVATIQMIDNHARTGRIHFYSKYFNRKFNARKQGMRHA